MSAATGNRSPLLSFVIGGAQKAGTSALARYLGAHPAIRLPRDKEAHVFDAPAFDEAGTAAQIDARFATHFDPAAQAHASLSGDATPYYLFPQRFGIGTTRCGESGVREG